MSEYCSSQVATIRSVSVGSAGEGCIMARIARGLTVEVSSVPCESSQHSASHSSVPIAGSSAVTVSVSVAAASAACTAASRRLAAIWSGA